MGRTYKILVGGKKAIGKTAILEQLIYSNPIYNTATNLSTSTTTNQLGHRLSNVSQMSNLTDRYFSTIEDIYVACWEKDKGIKEKLRFYDTKGMDSSKDAETINQMRHLFSSLDGAVLIYSSNDSDSIQCIEKLKTEIEKSKDKKEICHFILIDYLAPTPVNLFNTTSNSDSNLREQTKLDILNRFKMSSNLIYDLNNLEKRDVLCKPFIDLASNITQINNKSSMNSLANLKKAKVFSSNK